MEYKYRDLMRKLYDLKALAVPPMDGEKAGMYASYNRNCRYDPEKDEYIDWSRKGPSEQYFHSREDDEYVLMDQEGPGVIWRIWTAMNVTEEPYWIRIYLDGEEKPEVDMPMRDFFELHGDDVAPMNFPNLISTSRSRAWVSYLPIPFQKRIRITTPLKFMHHHFNYTLFPEDTVLPDYRDRYKNENCIIRAEVDRLLEDRGAPDEAAEWTGAEATVPAGGECTLFERTGAGAISSLRYYPSFAGGQNRAEILRKLIVKIYWDGQEQPAVWTPLGDFFGAAMGVHRYRTVPCGMHHMECYSNWYMPYQNGARIVLENRNDGPVDVRLKIQTEAPATHPADLLRFHAKWNPGEYLWKDKTRFQERGDRYPDWPVLLTKGRGRFCGMSLHVYNNFREAKNPVDSWWYGKWHPTLPYYTNPTWFWGEGREKVFVDGEKFPSIFGTGSEDYIGFSYSAEPPFPRWDSPFSAVPDVPLTGKGHTSQCRYQIADNIPFHDGLEFWTEKYQSDLWHNGREPIEPGDGFNCCYYDAISYWYMEPGRDDEYPAYGTELLWDRYHLPGEPDNR